MKSTTLLCKQHKNQAELLCLNKQCQNRPMCMLCEHNHELFTSVRIKQQVQIKKFRKIVDQSIDRSLRIIDQIQKGGIQKEKKMVVNYYQQVKQDFSKFIDLRMNQNLALLAPKGNSDLQFLIRSRIQGRYHQLPPQLFNKIRQVYQGKDLQTLARQQQQLFLQQAYSYMQQFHQNLSQLLHKFKLILRTKPPQIRISSSQLAGPRLHVQSSYDDDSFKAKLKQQIKYVTNVQIQAMITDGFSGKKQIITVGWDKKLRVWDKNLKIVHQKQYGNVLTKIQSIGQDTYAIGVSKQLHINKISHEDGYDPKHIMILKGHTQRIWDISAFNSRILGTSSQQGTKIWDLYKERCEYTLRQQINPSCLQFMTLANSLAIGYHSHNLKIYSISNMKPTRSYELPGVPLCLSQQNRNQNLIYCGGFSSELRLFDLRVAKDVFSHNFKSEAITCFKESLFDEETLLVGQRNGKARVFDLRKLKTRLVWDAHDKMTNLSKPNGVVRIFEQGFNQFLTIGCADRKAIIWQIKNVE